MDNMSVISLSSSSSDEHSSDPNGAPNRISWLGSPKMQAIIRQIEASTAARRRLTEWTCTCRACEVADRDKEHSFDFNNVCDDDIEENDNVRIRVDFIKNAQPPLIDSIPEKASSTQNNNKAVTVVANKANGTSKKITPENEQQKLLPSIVKIMKPTDRKEQLLDKRKSIKAWITSNQKRVDKVGDEPPKDAGNTSTLNTLEELKKKLERMDSLINRTHDKDVLPLPSAQYYKVSRDFDDSMMGIVQEVEKCRGEANGDVTKRKNEVTSTKKGKFKFTNDGELKKLTLKRTQGLYNSRRAHSLRSKGKLKNVSVDVLLMREKMKRKLMKTGAKNPDEKQSKVPQTPNPHRSPKIPKNDADKNNKVQKPVIPTLDERRSSSEMEPSLRIPEKKQRPESALPLEIDKTKNCKKKSAESALPTPDVDQSRCEIITVLPTPSDDDENADLRNFVDDMLELDQLSEEHRRSLILSRIFFPNSIANVVKQKSPKEDLKKACKIFTDISNDNKIRSLVEKRRSLGNNNTDDDDNHQDNYIKSQILREHSYSINETGDDSFSDETEEETTVEGPAEAVTSTDTVQAEISSVDIEPTPLEAPVVSALPPKNPKQLLGTTPKAKPFMFKRRWTNDGDNSKKLNHLISLDNQNGEVLSAFYVDHHLVVCQKHLVSFWTQSSLGNVLGAQNMWIPLGETKRAALHTTYVHKTSTEMVAAADCYVAYVEMWMKEHKSDFRERPIADVFVMVYFWKQGMKEPDKKALQLENIKSHPDDVQYVTVKCQWPGTQLRIVSSWHAVINNEKKTEVHSYLLAADFQTVASVLHFQSVPHYVSSLHNIEDCDNLVLGCGENKMTLWHLESGYVVAIITLDAIEPPLRTLWAKCDRAFLFTLQEGDDQELQLTVVNGLNWSWKTLQTYRAQSGFDHLTSAYLENGLLVAFYQQGILCWNAQTGDPVMEEIPNDIQYITSGKYIIMITKQQVIVKHALNHLLTAEDT